MKSHSDERVTTATRLATDLMDAEARVFAPSRMSSHAHWFHDRTDEHLVAVVAHDAGVNAVDDVMAYGLAWQGDRDLALVLPPDLVPVALTRIPWLRTKVRVYTPDDAGSVAPVVIPSRSTVLDQLGALPWRGRSSYAIDDERADWMEGVYIDDLIMHRRSCWSWHHRGLQILRVTTVRSGLRVQAGVQYTRPDPGWEPLDLTLHSAPTSDQLAAINRAVRRAVGQGGSRSARMDEHAMQHELSDSWDKLGFAGKPEREYAAHRGLSAATPVAKARPGYIDFLAHTPDGELRVVETKIGHDPRVVLQALDYLIYVQANRQRILDDLGIASVAGARERVGIDLVLGGKPATATRRAVKPFNRYLAGQLEALDGDVDVRVLLTEDPLASPPRMARYRLHELWDESDLVAAPVQPRRWGTRLTAELAG